VGYGEIIGGGPTARYTLRLDYGEATKTATLAALNEQLAILDVQIAAQVVRLAEAQAVVDAALLEVKNATDAFIAAGGTGNLSSTAAQAALQFLEQQRRATIEAQKLAIDPRLKLDALKVARAQVLDYIVRWNAAVTVQTKDAWCTDYTESGAGSVATIDIESESELTLVAPGCRGWTPSDGVMRATDVMSPEQCYWNLAALPGVQKFKPTYRWGTLTALDKDANLATVFLNSATSSQQSLGINQSSTLTGIPVVYMTCNARAFEVGDRVVVQFLGQDWSNPRVIGFLDNPRPCIQYVASYYVIGYGPLSSGNNHLFDTLERGRDEAWGNFTTVTPVAPWKFIQWSDGITSLMRNDGTATESISRTARYTLAPDFDYEYQFVFYWKSFGDSGTPGIKAGELAVAGQIVFKTSFSGATVFSPAAIPVGETIVWSGETTYSSADDAASAIQEAFPGSETVVSPVGPIYLPGYSGSSSATVVLKYGSSDNQYAVVGSKASETFPAGRIVGITTTSPDFVPGNFYTAKITYTATSWSATYA
jgi:hypothetical protein